MQVFLKTITAMYFRRTEGDLIHSYTEKEVDDRAGQTFDDTGIEDLNYRTTRQQPNTHPKPKNSADVMEDSRGNTAY